jgi:electron transfer flavoprotein beta subunit
MQIYVCIKHVPDTAANIKIIGTSEFNQSIKFVVNPYDEYGVEEAIRMVDKTGGEVIIVTVGAEAAVVTMRSALALGATRGILVKTDRHFLDSSLTSQALKKAIEADGPADLIFTGKQSVDSEGMQTQYRLAQAFNIPIATEVVSCEIKNGTARVEREIGGGRRVQGGCGRRVCPAQYAGGTDRENRQPETLHCLRSVGLGAALCRNENLKNHCGDQQR